MDTHDASLDEVHRLLQSGYPAAAWELLGQRPSTTATNWEVLYLAGQCRRFLDDYSGAIALLSRSAALAPRVAPVLLALGIAYQLDERFDEAKKALALAIEVDPDYALAFNSLAMTQKLTGEWDKSVHNYDAGCKALARAIVKGMQNRPDSLIIKYRKTRGTLWTEHALHAALHLVAGDHGLAGVAFPTGGQTELEERTEAHRGLYWDDGPNEQGERVRMFLPNYFNTFREALRQDTTYANLIGNRGTVLALLKRDSEAKDHLAEAEEFMPKAG